LPRVDSAPNPAQLELVWARAVPIGENQFKFVVQKSADELTPKQAAAYISIPLKTLYDHLAAGVIPCRRVSAHRLRVSRADCERFIEGSKDPEYWTLEKWKT
jgi:excisionase family DNA binding protein